jgi:antitoxin MazE
MVKRLIKHGNSLALVLDKPVLDLLKITEETPLEIETLDGKSLHIKPVKSTGARKDVRTALDQTNKKFGKTLKNLSK